MTDGSEARGQPSRDEAGSSAGAAPFSVVIPTRDRWATLQEVLRSVQRQTVPCEIIVADDGSRDETAQALPREFPEVTYLRRSVSAGPTACRNEGARRAHGRYLVTLDDDCVLADERALEKAAALFSSPRIAAVTLPFVNVREDAVVRTAAPATGEVHVTLAFYGGMVMFRRDLFFAAGQYRELLFMHGEEFDLGVRLLNLGYYVRAGEGPLIHHLKSPVRDGRKLWQLGARNAVLYVLLNVPAPCVPLHLAGTLVFNLLYAWPRGAVPEVLHGFAAAGREIRAVLRGRRPLSWGAYLLSRRLSRCGTVPLHALRAASSHG